MSNVVEVHSEQIVPVTITFSPEAFSKALETIPLNKDGWAGGDQVGFVEHLLGNMEDPDGNPIKLDDNSMDRLRVVYGPKEETQRRVVVQTFTDAGFKLSESALDILSSLIGTVTFAKKLSKSNRPGTKTPYITLKKKKGDKKETLDAAFSAMSTTPASSERAGEVTDQDAQEPDGTDNPGGSQDDDGTPPPAAKAPVKPKK